MRNVVVNSIATLGAAWSGFLSWWFGLVTPKCAVTLPRLVLALDSEETVRTKLPRQVVRL
ncbi:hypothetical protein ACFQ7A_11195 [Streptomyces sp. NPDC056528]|uniref:hypothetical protein n=1 Tax=Streptomyces sp. NPDC056528 TaxID=3345854 RepID=UPI0036ABBC74